MPTKKQHYVPQLILRRFANQVKQEWRTNLYDISRDQYRLNQNIKDVCAENYTYDKDNTFEHFLDEHIETPAGVELDTILKSPSGTCIIPSAVMLRFLIVQLARTRQAYEDGMEFFNQFMGTVFETFAQLNDHDAEAAKRIRVSPGEPRALLAYMAANAAANYGLLSDLRVAIVKNDTSQPFILSDHPVFQHNWYLRDCNEPLSAAITVCGLQFFLPLSPSIIYCLYDPKVYVYRSGSREVVVRASVEDVNLLNSFQAISADSFLVTPADNMRATLTELGKRFAEVEAFTSTGESTPPVEIGDGKLKSSHYAWRQQVRLCRMPSFVKVKNRVRRRSLVCVHRSPDIVLAHKLADAHRNRESAD